MEPQAPVRTETQTPSVLVCGIDLKVTKRGLTLVFNGPDSQEVARLRLQAKPLRQWLGILHAQYQKAQWPTGVWPSWIEEAKKSTESTRRGSILH